MPAYSRPIRIPPCPECGRPSSCTVFNSQNAEVGPRCARHGDALVARLNQEASSGG